MCIFWDHAQNEQVTKCLCLISRATIYSINCIVAYIHLCKVLSRIFPLHTKLVLSKTFIFEHVGLLSNHQKRHFTTQEPSSISHICQSSASEWERHSNRCGGIKLSTDEMENHSQSPNGCYITMILTWSMGCLATRFSWKSNTMDSSQGTLTTVHLSNPPVGIMLQCRPA